MLRKLVSCLILFLSISSQSEQVGGQTVHYIGEGVRQNTTLSTFDSYRMVHYAASAKRELSAGVARMLHLTMLADWGPFFTKAKMVEALEQALEANTTPEEFGAFSSEAKRFKSTMLSLPINSGSQLKFYHIPGSGLEILMEGPRGFLPVFRSPDQKFSLKIFAVWLGNAHRDANNRENMLSLIEDLWQNAE